LSCTMSNPNKQFRFYESGHPPNPKQQINKL
jgi:hypothetical protein